MHVRPILTPFVLMWGRGIIHQWPTSQHALWLSWIHFLQGDTAAGQREAERDRDHPTRRNIRIYGLHPHCQGIPHGGWRGNSDLKPAPLQSSMPLLGHTMTLSGRVLSWIGTSASTPLMAPVTVRSGAAPAASPPAEGSQCTYSSFPPPPACARSFLPVSLHVTVTKDNLLKTC